MEGVFDSIMEEVDRGRKGLNAGISIGLDKLEGVIDGVTRSTYTLIISSSGSGKSSFALYAYVYKPLMEHLDDDNYRAIFFALEMSATSMLIKLMSIYIFETYGRVLTYREILSRRRGFVLDEEGYELVKKCRGWVDKVSKKIEFYDKSLNASSMYAILCQRLDKMGEFVETETRKAYIPDNPHLTYTVIIDHIGLVRPQSGRTLKQEIDLMSSYLVTLREMCGITPVVIQQANRDHSNIERYKAGKSAFTMADAQDSSGPSHDCNVMLALFDPFKEGIKTYCGYQIDQLGGTFRTCQVLKNRFGECDVEVPLSFYGGINYFRELPPADTIADYNRLRYPQAVVDQLFPTGLPKL